MLSQSKRETDPGKTRRDGVGQSRGGGGRRERYGREGGRAGGRAAG